MTIAAIFALLSRYGSPVLTSAKTDIWPWIKAHYKQILFGALFLWCIMCTLTHCTGLIDPWGRHSAGISDTVSVRIDTAWVYPDTSAIFALVWGDTLPYLIERLNDNLKRKWAKPKTPIFPIDATYRDSIVNLLAYINLLEGEFNDCDDAFLDAITTRSYGDTLRNDSIEVAVNFRVEGFLKGKPVVNYRYLAPYPIITKEISMEKTLPPRAQVYIGGNFGPRFTWNDNAIDALSGGIELGFTTRKSLSLGINGSVTHKDYSVGVSVRKGFNVGR